MIKSEVPGLMVDGKGVAVQHDLTAYHEMIAKRRAKAEMDALREEITVMRSMIEALSRSVEELKENSK